MKKIFVRSPYFAEAIIPSNRSSATFFIYLWNKGDTEPTTPKYTVVKPLISQTQRDVSINISNLAKEFIKPEFPLQDASLFESNKMWCYCKVQISFLAEILSSTETFVCLNGYSNYERGYNYNITSLELPLFDVGVKVNFQSYVDFWIDESPTEYNWNGTNEFVSEGNLYRLKLKEGNNVLYNSVGNFSVFLEQICVDTAFDYRVIEFVNRFGGWTTLGVNANFKTSLEVESKSFSHLQNSINYKPYIGQSRQFNFNSKRKIKINTGWVDENYSLLIESLMTSETILLSGSPVLLKNKNIEFKTRLTDNNINYELEFEYNYNVINDQI